MSNDMRNKFSSNLQHYLKEKNKTQKELADFLGVAPASVNKYIKGITFPRFEKIKQISIFLEISQNELLGTKDTLNSRHLQSLISEDIEHALTDYSQNLKESFFGKEKNINIALFEMFPYLDIEDKKEIIKLIVELFKEYDGLDDNDKENIKNVSNWISKKQKNKN